MAKGPRLKFYIGPSTNYMIICKPHFPFMPVLGGKWWLKLEGKTNVPRIFRSLILDCSAIAMVCELVGIGVGF